MQGSGNTIIYLDGNPVWQGDVAKGKMIENGGTVVVGNAQTGNIYIYIYIYIHMYYFENGGTFWVTPTYIVYTHARTHTHTLFYYFENGGTVVLGNAQTGNYFSKVLSI